jgi:hypothetical protein
MSLRDAPATARVTLPDGRVIGIRVGLAQDSYIPPDQMETIVAELTDEATGEHLGAVSTILEVADGDAARALAREIADGLHSGELEPTAGAIEPLAERLP